MSWLINLVGRLAGVSGWFSKASPLLLSASALLGALSHILGQAGQVSTTAQALDLVRGLAVSPDGAVIALSLAAMKKHFNHNDNAARISELESKLAEAQKSTPKAD